MNVSKRTMHRLLEKVHLVTLCLCDCIRTGGIGLVKFKPLGVMVHRQ